MYYYFLSIYFTIFLVLFIILVMLTPPNMNIVTNFSPTFLSEIVFVLERVCKFLIFQIHHKIIHGSVDLFSYNST